MEFEKFKKLQQKHVARILEDQDNLFVVDLDKDALYELYLDSFPKGTNEVYRERREFDCSCCKQFIRNFGNVVTLKDNKIVTVWDFQTKDPTYQPVIDALSKKVRSSKVKNVFITKEIAFGTDFNLEKSESGDVRKWHHYRVNLPKKFVNKSNKTEDSVMGELRAVKEVFQRSLEEISADAVETVLELIAQNSLYKGDEWKGALTKFLKLHKQYHKLTKTKRKNNYCWTKSIEVGAGIGKIKNHSIGVLLTDISNEEDLDASVKRYEKIVAPSNYKRPKAIYTKKMVDQAQIKIADLGLTESLGRRHANIDDINVKDILFANKDAMRSITGNVFDELKVSAKVSQKKFTKLEKIPIELFVSDILPKVTDIEVFVENKHSPNFMSLVAPKKSRSKNMFKWKNNFSWAYNGNITDSMKERVKSAGGKVDGVLRFSIQWNDNGDNNNDFDAHCHEPGGNLIYYGAKNNYQTLGNLDVDIQTPNANVAVENITWSNESRMQEGVYTFLVHNYAHRGGRSGFSAEIEYGGEIYSYDYQNELRQGESVIVAKIKYSRKDGIKFIESLPSTTSSKTIWDIATQQFQPVSVCMHSPNYWDDKLGVGHKHYFFIMNNCKNEDNPNGFFNEFLKEELMTHKRVFEALGSKMRVDNASNQLSGLGFSSTQRNNLICKLKGKFNRTVELTF